MRAEIDRHGDSVAAVTIEKERGRAIAGRIAPADDGKRDARAVGSGGMQTLANVLGRIVPSKNGLLLPKTSLACAYVIVKDRARSHERLILESHLRGVEFRIFPDGSVVGGLGELDAMRCRKNIWGDRGQIHDAKMREAALAFKKHEVVPESLRGSQHDVRAMGDDLTPGFSASFAHRGGHQAEGAPSGIRANVKHSVIGIRGRPAMVVGVILMVVFARTDKPEFSGGLTGAQETDFAGCMTRDGEK